MGWLRDDHWLDLARHANKKAWQLQDGLAGFSDITLQWPCEANELFVTMPAALAENLLRAGAEFYEWPSHALPPG